MKQHLHHVLTPLKRTLVAFAVMLGILFCSYKGFGQLVLPFSGNLTGIFPGIDTNNASILFDQGGYNFPGTIFITTGETLTSPESITLSGISGPYSLSCSTKVRGLYYTTMRGQRLWPLDITTKNILTTNDASYATMSLTGGLFTNCTGRGFIPTSNAIFGQLDHTLNGNNYRLIAGVTYNFTGNYVEPHPNANFLNNLIASGGQLSGYIFDTMGGIGRVSGTGTISSNASCNSFTGTFINETGANIQFICNATNPSQYILTITGTPSTGSTITTGSSSYTWKYNLPAGNYTASCSVNPGNLACTTLSFTITPPLTGGTPMTPPTTFTGVRFVGSIPNIDRADINKAYKSNNFTIEGLNTTGFISISKGLLYINGTGNSTGGYVKNNDVLNIELISSPEYKTTVSSTLQLSGSSITGNFSITTKSEEEAKMCTLSNTQKLSVTAIFNSLKSTYSKTSSLFTTMQSMIKDMQDFDFSCNLEYLGNLIDDYLEGNGDDDTLHTAPNCKEYTIKYVDGKGYTSSKFKRIVYFNDIDALRRFIDSNNPGECNIRTYPDEAPSYDNNDPTKHIAPNGKLYDIKESSKGFYTPNAQSIRYFSDLDSLRYYIDKNNPTFLVWSHEVDTSFEPITYVAPNEKTYKIYLTDKGYMSYKLLKPRYFDTLEGIQSFIDKNNK